MQGFFPEARDASAKLKKSDKITAAPEMDPKIAEYLAKIEPNNVLSLQTTSEYSKEPFTLFHEYAHVSLGQHKPALP
jgi:Zn-dependent peptidase ImmA (M78 family)